MEFSHNELEKRRLAELPIPSASDFFSEPGGDDAEAAWEHFGGLTLEQAYRKFMESPDYRQEDFMWMLPKAFEYYFPVLDRYLRSVSAGDRETLDQDWKVWIIGCDISLQLRGTRAVVPQYLLAEIASLSDFVKDNLSLYSLADEEETRSREVWLEIDQAISEFEKCFTHEQLPSPAESP